jgi:TMEM175 potassium channel family protein
MKFPGTAGQSSANTVNAGQWYVIDLRVRTGANPHTIDWQVDDVAQTQSTNAVAADTNSNIRFDGSITTEAFTAYFDDMIYTADGNDYPIGAGGIHGLVPSFNRDQTNPATILSPGVPYHVAISYDGSNIRTYYNGVLAGTTASARGGQRQHPARVRVVQRRQQRHRRPARRARHLHQRTHPDPHPGPRRRRQALGVAACPGRLGPMDAVEGRSEPGADERSLGLDRMIFFSDAVFAIVITLLVLPIAIDVELPGSGGLAHAVWSLWPRMLSFALSFLVIGQFWTVHHRMFEHVRRYDLRLLWLNLLVLLAVSFLPFPTSLLGTHSTATDRFPVVFYAASLAAVSLTLTVMLLYVLWADGLVDEHFDRAEIRHLRLRGAVTTGPFVVSVGAAFLGLWVAILFWVVLVPGTRALLTRRHRRARRTL